MAHLVLASCGCICRGLLSVHGMSLQQPPAPAFSPQDSQVLTTHYRHHYHELPSSPKRARPSLSLEPSIAMASNEQASSPTTPEPQSPEAYDASGSLLYTLLHRDVEPEGHRMILPFFTTDDLLRLSECSRGLLKYRNNLLAVKIVPQEGSRWGTMRRSLVRLLSEQHSGVRYLRIGDPSLVSVLSEVVNMNRCSALTTLDLSDIKLSDEDAAVIGRALPGLVGLEELLLCGACSEVTATGLGHMMGALAHGACPGLRHLNFSDNEFSEDVECQVIATALESGHCRRLQELDLSNTVLDQVDFNAVARALCSGNCPEMRRLNLSSCSLDRYDGRALGLALRSGACPKFEKLELSYNDDMGDDGLVPVMEALEAGSCPELKLLDLESTRLEAGGGTALGLALSSGRCSHLQELILQCGSVDRVGTLRILEAIKRGVCPDLRHLDLGGNKMDEEHGKMLGEVLASGSCLKLEELELSDNESLGDVGVMHVARALEAGGCPVLEVLELSHVGMGPDAAMALAKALGSGSLGRLQEINVGQNPAIQDEAMAELIRALGSSAASREIRSLSTMKSGMGDDGVRAVLKGLSDGAWPHLEEMSVMIESENDGWMPCLASVLAEGSGSTLRKIHLNCRVKADGFRKLAQAFWQGACPALKELEVDAKLTEHVDGSCVEDLRASLEGRAELVIDFLD